MTSSSLPILMTDHARWRVIRVVLPIAAFGFCVVAVADAPPIQAAPPPPHLESETATAPDPILIASPAADSYGTVPVNPRAVLRRFVVTTGADGRSITSQTALRTSAGREGAASCLDAADSIYCNTAGAFVYGNSGSATTLVVADDIVTTGGAGCLLDRYVIRVTGDRRQKGTGVGAYTVNYAMHESCPGANITPQIIPGTQGSMQVPAEFAGDIVEIEHLVASGLPLEASQMYLGISFDRDLCGSVVGAPALKGYSADQLDIPGSPCDAWLGGFPGAPHASLYAEIYTHGDCAESFISYRNSNHTELAVQEDELVRLADDFVMAEDCKLVAYEVAFKPAVVEVDLRFGPGIGGPDGPFMPGTRAQFAPCVTCGVQVERIDVDPPIQLFAGDVHWLTFMSLNAGKGPILTCRPPFVGETADQYLAYNITADQWETRFGTGRCWNGFDLTLYCEGTPPKGACCDMVLTECVGGPNDGEPCFNNARCQPGTCESVCREVPELNCTAEALNAPSLWRESGSCGPACVGGSRDGQACAAADDCPEGACEGPFCIGGESDGSPCTREADCPDGTCEGGPFAGPCGTSACCKPRGSFCVGGIAENDPCEIDEDCPGGDCVPVEAIGVCENLTKNECYAVPPQGIPRRFQSGLWCGVGGQECPLYPCLTRSGDCTRAHEAFCVGGQNDREPCNPLDTSPGVCATNSEIGNFCGGNCLGGTSYGEICDPLGVFVEECAGGACPGGRCVEAHCVGRPGCADEFCCTDVCLSPGMFYCCSVHWDSACAERTCSACGQRPFWEYNDECFDPGPCYSQSQLVSVPDTIEVNSISASPEVAPAPGEGTDPGFCCHADEPGTGGVGTLWYKFIAPETSVLVSTCGSVARQRDGISYRAEDSLIAIYAPGEPYRGVCGDQATVCDVIEQDCPDGSLCVFDERTACDTLTPIACNDDDGVCGENESRRAGVCASGLIPGQMYYVQVAGKTNEPDPGDPKEIVRGNGVWRLNISAPCSVERPTMANDACTGAYLLEGADNETLRVPFDLSGDTVGQCEGGRGAGDLCVIARNTCPDAAPCVPQAAATFDCPGPPVSCDFSTFRNDTWYEWTAPTNGEAVFTTCGDEGDADTPDTGLVLYDCCECPANPQCINTCSWFTPSPCLGGSLIRAAVEKGQCYQLRLAGHFGEEPAGELKISVGSFCGNDRYDAGRCISGDHDSLLCTSNADCPGGICGEECDGGSGCAADCQCLPGWCVTPIPSRNCYECEPSCAHPVSSYPTCDSTMPRTESNVINVQYASVPVDNIASIQVRELLNGGGFGADVTAEFTLADAGNNVLELTNTGTPLSNATWYAITDCSNLNMQILVLYGDVNGDGAVNAFDASAIWTNRGPAAAKSPFDINGDGKVDAIDVNGAWANRAVVPPPKPTGHDCFP